MKILRDYVEVKAEVWDAYNGSSYYLEGMIDFNDMGDIKVNAYDRENFFRELDKGFHVYRDKVISVKLKFFGRDDMVWEVERD